MLTLREGGAPLLNVFGGKITTYRRLSEAALAKLVPFFPNMGKNWTTRAPLPGGDFPVDGVQAQIDKLKLAFPFLSHIWARRLVQTYGTDAFLLLNGAITPADLGEDFGATLTMAEVEWLMEHEFARTAEDVLWRRTKLGLRLTQEDAKWLDLLMQKHFEHLA